MTLLLLALLQVAPRMEEGPSAPMPGEGPWFLKSSSTGKFLTVLRKEGVTVIDPATLKTVKEIGQVATGVGFDAKDETLTVAGDSLVKYEAATWKETFRGKLEGAETGYETAGIVVERDPKPKAWVAGRSYIAADGTVYYRREKGLAEASIRDGKLACANLTFKSREEVAIQRVLGESGGSLLVGAGDRGQAWVALRGSVYTLAASNEMLTMAPVGDAVVVVCRRSIGIYDPATWKSIDQGGGPEKDNRAVAIDPKREMVWLARPKTLVACHLMRPDVDLECPGVKGDFTGIELSRDGETLYAVDGKTLRSWKIKK